MVPLQQFLRVVVVFIITEKVILAFPILSFDSFESEKVVKCDSCGYHDY